jgi:VWFA-related protein
MRRKFHLVVLLALAGLLISAGYVLSQVRASVPLVVVPVNVRDAGGEFVIGLTKDDFIVEEDGRPQPLTYFSVDPLPISAAIVIDDGVGSNALKRLVPLMNVLTSGFSNDDEMVAFRYDHIIWKLSDFTKDHAAIERAFNELPRIAETRPAEGEPGEPAAAGPSWLRAIGGLITIGSNGPPSTGRVPTAADPPKRPPTSRLLHDAIYEAADALRTRPADNRRIIMIISDGQVSGANKHSLEKNMDFLLANQIQVYSVGVDYALREGSLGVLSAYSNSTGGDTYSGGSTHDMETAFQRITEQARNQYILGYISDTRPRAGVYRSIDVKTTKPNLKVTHRKGYTQFPIN